MRRQLHQHQEAVQERAGVRMLGSTFLRLGAAAFAAAVAVGSSPAFAQAPSYQLDSSGGRVVRLSNLTPGEGCHPASASGRVVRREFDKTGLVVSGFVVEETTGDRSFINVDQSAIDSSRLGLATRGWILSGLSTLLSEGQEVRLGVKLCGASGRVAVLDDVSPRSAPATTSTPSAAAKIGPSFDCGTKAVSTQPLAQMICVSPELSLWELGYVIAYQAVRESASPAGKKAMVDEANALVVEMNSDCGLPASGKIQQPPAPADIACIRGKFSSARASLISRATGLARDEAVLVPSETIAIQAALQSQNHLPTTAALDGVFGPMTRTAIASWQRENGQRETGFGSKAMLQQLGGLPPAAAAAAPPPPRPAAAPPTALQAAPLSVDRTGKTSGLRLALNDGTELKPQDIFEKAGKAVYVVKSAASLGSAVAISDRELLTNCHVLGNSAVVTLEREGARLYASVVSANADADRCVLRSPEGEPLPAWVRVRPYADVKVGERVFTIGAPRGLELSLAEGIVSSKRVADDGRLIQTSAPISRGSSGGGLFDAQGNLIGITTFMIKDAQNINFAIAAEEYAK